MSRPFASKKLLAGAVAVAGAVALAARAADGGCVLQVWWVVSGAAPMFCIAVMRVSSRGTPASTSIGGGGVEPAKSERREVQLPVASQRRDGGGRYVKCCAWRLG